jgi:hypothetical protein
MPFPLVAAVIIYTFSLAGSAVVGGFTLKKMLDAPKGTALPYEEEEEFAELDTEGLEKKYPYMFGSGEEKVPTRLTRQKGFYGKLPG